MKKTTIGLAAGSVALGMLLSSSAIQATADTTTTTTVAPTTTTTLAPPVQGQGPVQVAFQVDTVVGSGGTGILKAPVGCAQTNEFYVGQTVVFRMYAENVAAGGVVLTGANTVSATVTIPGVTAPMPMNYGNHGSAAFWSLGWNTKGYTTGIVHFTITVVTAKVPAVTKTVTLTKRVAVRVNGKPVYKNGKLVTRLVSYKKTIVVTPAVPGQTATFTQAGFSPNSMLTINPVPAA